MISVIKKTSQNAKSSTNTGSMMITVATSCFYKIAYYSALEGKRQEALVTKITLVARKGGNIGEKGPS